MLEPETQPSGGAVIGAWCGSVVQLKREGGGKCVSGKKSKQYSQIGAAAAVAVAAMLGSFSTARTDSTGDAVTVSLSGSAAIRNFTTSMASRC